MNNALLKAMSSDMRILRYQNESDEAFTYRLCYSALGQWCLNIGCNNSGDRIGTTKHNQTIVLNELLTRYLELFPAVSDRFFDTSNQLNSVSVFIRRIYEETGYLLTDENNHNRLANFGRSIDMGNESLFFGLPSDIYAVNGLGVFAAPTTYTVDAKDFLIRDNLTCEEYFQARFDQIDFYERDIDLQELEIFNPLSNRVPSQSWCKDMTTDCSVVRRFETGPFYRIMRTSSGILFADEPVEIQTDSFTSHEYRRLYFAMKRHYGKPLSIRITKLDDNYSKIQVGGHLPNREYYLMLLLSWPERSAFDKVSFIMKNNLLEYALTVLENIGLKVKGGCIHE